MRLYLVFCDKSTKTLLVLNMGGGGGVVKNDQKLRDVIYRQPLIVYERQKSDGQIFFRNKKTQKTEQWN